jgi:hypothetical protein
MEFLILLAAHACRALEKSHYSLDGKWMINEGSVWTPCYTEWGTIYQWAWCARCGFAV